MASFKEYFSGIIPIPISAVTAARFIKLYHFRYHRIDLTDGQALSYAISVVDPKELLLLPTSTGSKYNVTVHCDTESQIRQYMKETGLTMSDIASAALKLTAAALDKVERRSPFAKTRLSGVRNMPLTPQEKLYLLDDFYTR